MYRQFHPSRQSSGFGRAGWVYILTNPAMPGLVKIGLTTRSPTERMAELTKATGVPEPFVMVWNRAVRDCGQVEETAHRMLKDRRVHQGREFFRCDPATAQQVIEAAAGGQLGREYRPPRARPFWRRRQDRYKRRGGVYHPRWRRPPDYTPAVLALGALVILAVFIFKPFPPAWVPEWFARALFKIEGRA